MSGRPGYLVKAQELEEGFNLIVEPGTCGLRYLSFGRHLLHRGGDHSGSTDGNEACLVVLSGSCSVTVKADEEITYSGVGQRDSVFTGAPDIIYLPRGAEYRLVAESDELHTAFVSSPARRDTAPARVDGSGLERAAVGADNWRRDAYFAVADNVDADRLLVGETFNEPGNWSSYPPHKHDETSAVEAPYEEIYFYMVDPPQGFGVQRLYTAPDDPNPIDEVYVVESGDAVVIPRGYHPVAAAAGYRLYYLWALAGEERQFGQWSDDPTHSWIRSLEAD
jgi:5-deoxy-glucuronate isomerase